MEIELNGARRAAGGLAACHLDHDQVVQLPKIARTPVPALSSGMYCEARLGILTLFAETVPTGHVPIFSVPFILRRQLTGDQGKQLDLGGAAGNDELPHLITHELHARIRCKHRIGRAAFVGGDLNRRGDAGIEADRQNREEDEVEHGQYGGHAARRCRRLRSALRQRNCIWRVLLPGGLRYRRE